MRKQVARTRWVIAAALTLLIGLLAHSTTVAQPPDAGQKAPVRELYVPYDSLDALLGAGAERVFSDP